MRLTSIVACGMVIPKDIVKFLEKIHQGVNEVRWYISLCYFLSRPLYENDTWQSIIKVHRRVTVLPLSNFMWIYWHDISAWSFIGQRELGVYLKWFASWQHSQARFANLIMSEATMKYGEKSFLAEVGPSCICRDFAHQSNLFTRTAPGPGLQQEYYSRIFSKL